MIFVLGYTVCFKMDICGYELSCVCMFTKAWLMGCEGERLKEEVGAF